MAGRPKCALNRSHTTPASGVRNPRPTRPRRATRPVLVLAPRARRRSSAAARLLQPDGLKVLAASAVRLG